MNKKFQKYLIIIPLILATLVITSAQDGANPSLGAVITNMNSYISPNGVANGGFTIPTANCYGWIGASNSLCMSGSNTQIKSGDGGAYFYAGNGTVYINSSSLTIANGGVPKFNIPAVTATDGQALFTNGASTIGVGIDVATDSVFKVRTRAQAVGAIVNSGFQSAGAVPAVSNTTANSCGTTAATIAGNDNSGVITVGATAGTNCTITFVTAAPTRRECTSSNETTGNLSRTTYLTTTTSTVEGTFVAGDLISYICFAR